jgi:predicted DNA-binding antitoxin AbrB/MazE fold protein
MTYDIEAIYNDGVFRPLMSIAIPDGARVHLRIEEHLPDDSAAAQARRRAAMDEFLRLAKELPLEGPNDGFSGADHDRVLYGNP